MTQHPSLSKGPDDMHYNFAGNVLNAHAMFPSDCSRQIGNQRFMPFQPNWGYLQFPSAFVSGTQYLSNTPNHSKLCVGVSGKRKAPADSSRPGSAKQHITEARITASLQGLSLNQDRPTDRENARCRRADEGFFDGGVDDFVDCDDLPDLPVDDDDSILDSELTRVCDINGGWSERQTPTFHMAPDIKQNMDKILEPILPKVIVDSIVARPCLALVPYKPPVSTKSCEEGIAWFGNGELQGQDKKNATEKKVHRSDDPGDDQKMAIDIPPFKCKGPKEDELMLD